MIQIKTQPQYTIPISEEERKALYSILHNSDNTGHTSTLINIDGQTQRTINDLRDQFSKLKKEIK